VREYVRRAERVSQNRVQLGLHRPRSLVDQKEKEKEKKEKGVLRTFGVVDHIGSGRLDVGVERRSHQGQTLHASKERVETGQILYTRISKIIK
jgi:hypothetical protein